MLYFGVGLGALVGPVMAGFVFDIWESYVVAIVYSIVGRCGPEWRYCPPNLRTMAQTHEDREALAEINKAEAGGAGN